MCLIEKVWGGNFNFIHFNSLACELSAELYIIGDFERGFIANLNHAIILMLAHILFSIQCLLF